MFGIGYVNKPIVPCTKALFLENIRSKVVADTIDLITRLEKVKAETTDEKKRKWADQSIAQAKRSLPCITPMAYFKDNKRSVKNAIPSGLNMIDVDHVKEPAELWMQISKKELPYKVALAHITPSGFGLRIIFVQPEGKDIAEAQAEMAKACGVVHDEVTKDLARCSFLVPSSYVLFMDEGELLAEREGSALTNRTKPAGKPAGTVTATENGKPAGTVAGDGAGGVNASSSNSNYSPCGGEGGSTLPAGESGERGQASFPSEFRHIPYSEIIKLLLFAASYDDTPAEGERNNALYGLARSLRYICDFNVDFVISVLPDWGLSAQEVRATVTSAVNSVRKATMPKQLAQIINSLSKQYTSLGEQYTADWDYVVEPQGLIGEFVKLQPKYLKNACYISAMACLGTLLTRLRGKGMNGDKLALNFEVAISAPQATGKSFMTKVYRQICAPIHTEDDRQRKIKRDIDKENKRNKDKDDYEEKEFEGAIRLLPTNVSNRILLERTDKAKGQHLMICASEIDSITKAEKSGKWSEKSDVYRLAYDNDEWGQDYAAENSYQAVVNLYLNLLFSGTPAAVSRFFSDIENGLITRFLFCDLPDTFGQPRPMRISMDEQTEKAINDKLQQYYEQMKTTSDENNEVWIDTTQMVEDVKELYDEKQRRMYLVNQLDPSRDLARRRYADYAVKMMMIETYLNDGVYTEEIRDRVIGVIDYCTEQLLALHGDAINESLNESTEKHEKAKKRSKKKNMLEFLPDRFTTQEFSEAAISFGYSVNSIKATLQRMCTGGVLVHVSHGLYSKI